MKPNLNKECKNCGRSLQIPCWLNCDRKECRRDVEKKRYL